MELCRGLPAADYYRLRNRIIAGELTWAQAVELGYCLPAAKRGPKRKPLKVLKPTKAKRPKSKTKTA